MSAAGGQLPIEKQIQQNYAVGLILSTQPTDHCGVWMLETPQGRFVAKFGQREDHLRLHVRAQQALQEHGLRCNLVVPTAEGALLTPQGLALFTWVPGDCVRTLDAARRDGISAYLPTYLQALAMVPCSEGDFSRCNGWDDAQSLDYLLTHFTDQLAGMPLPEDDRAVLLSAIERLRVMQPRLQLLARQLIHADLGPDNFLFDGSRVTAVIDFTPAYDSPLYAMAQFLYWNDLYPDPSASRAELLERFRAFDPSAWADDLMLAMLLRAALYRAVGPLLEMAQAGAIDQERLRRRILCLRALLG